MPNETHVTSPNCITHPYVPIEYVKDDLQVAGLVRIFNRFCIRVKMTEPCPGVTFVLKSKRKSLAHWDQLSREGRETAINILMRIERAIRILAWQRVETRIHLECFKEALLMEEILNEKFLMAEEKLENTHDTSDRIRISAEIIDYDMGKDKEWSYRRDLYEYFYRILGIELSNVSYFLMAEYALEKEVSPVDVEDEEPLEISPDIMIIPY